MLFFRYTKVVSLCRKKVQVVEEFRHGLSLKRHPRFYSVNKNQIDDYAYLREYHEKMNSMDGLQLGDPNKIADVFLALISSKQPAVNLFLGSDAFSRAKSKLEQLSIEMENWKEISQSTDFSA